ncbi:putative prophage CPS-53 integrase [compost metagenome]
MEVAGAVPHGFRSTFRTWAAEHTDYPREICEAALAHSLGSKVEAAYNRGDLLEKRRRLMQDWCEFLATHNPVAVLGEEGMLAEEMQGHQEEVAV